MNKIDYSIQVIRDAFKPDATAAMLSFGKDSMVLAHLIREAIPAPNLIRFPLPVIYHRHPWFPHKNAFADEVIRSWAMEIHDWTPMFAGIKVKPELLELVARYNFGNGVLDIPVNVVEPVARRDFLCGMNDWVKRPKSPGTLHEWKVIFHGHKSSDVDQFGGRVPLNSQSVICGGIRVVFPLRDWTDDDVWDYIEEHNIPYQQNRYFNRRELEDKWDNPDWIHACTACLDPRNPDRVYCPKLKMDIENVSDQVLRIQVRPEYIGG